MPAVGRTTWTDISAQRLERSVRDRSRAPRSGPGGSGLGSAAERTWAREPGAWAARRCPAGRAWRGVCATREARAIWADSANAQGCGFAGSTMARAARSASATATAQTQRMRSAAAIVAMLPKQQPASRMATAAGRAWPVTLGSRSRATVRRCSSARSRRRRRMHRCYRSAGRWPRLFGSVRQRWARSCQPSGPAPPASWPRPPRRGGGPPPPRLR